jgi:hypothetical protein
MSFWGIIIILFYPAVIGFALWLLYRGVKALETIVAKMKDNRSL